MRYALIVDGIVANIIRLHPRNAAAFNNVVSINNIPVTIGDKYINGKFYRNGAEVTTRKERSV